MIAVLSGGNSNERDISLRSGRAVFAALGRRKIDAFLFDWCGDNLAELWRRDFDKAFIALHGRGGEDGVIQKQLEVRKIPYTGTRSKPSKNCMNKARTIEIWRAAKMPVARSVVVCKNEPLPEIPFSAPFAVKPIGEGSSLGVSKIYHRKTLPEALEIAWQYDLEALVEEWIDGVEYTATILNDAALPILEIVPPGEFFDYRSKYLSEKTRYLRPTHLSKTDEVRLGKIALAAFRALGARTWGRIDFIVDKKNHPFLLEINTVPGMTDHSLVPLAAKFAGIDFDELVLRILND